MKLCSRWLCLRSARACHASSLIEETSVRQQLAEGTWTEGAVSLSCFSSRSKLFLCGALLMVYSTAELVLLLLHPPTPLYHHILGSIRTLYLYISQYMSMLLIVYGKESCFFIDKSIFNFQFSIFESFVPGLYGPPEGPTASQASVRLDISIVHNGTATAPRQNGSGRPPAG